MQQTPLRTQKFHAVFNFLVLAALMKLVTHLTVKGKIYNPPVQMRRLNLSSNRLIFSTELKGRKKKCRSFSLFSASLALSCFLPFSSSLTPVGWIRKLQMTKFNTSLTNSIPAPSTPAWGRFLGRPAGSGGQPGAEGHYNRRETLGCGGAQERTLYYDVWPRMAESGHLKHTHLEGASDCRICSRKSGSTSAMWILPLLRSSTPQTDSSSACSTTMSAG